MLPKFASPHALSQGVELTTRSEIAGRGGFTSTVPASDEESRSLKRRDLDNLLRDTWGDALAETSSPSRAKQRWKTGEGHNNGHDQLVFRLLSSMKRPQCISLDPKPLSLPVTRGPDCEDDEMQAQVRRTRAQSVAVESECLREAAVSNGQVHPKSASPVEVKVLLTQAPLSPPLPPLLVVEVARATTRFKTGRPQVDASPAASPHEPRPSCRVLPVMSVPNDRETLGRKRRKTMTQRPAPAYWRPPPDMRGKCMGYALGYPSSWAPDQRYVRDAMKRGVKST